MARARAWVLLLLPGAAGYNCTGQPRNWLDLRSRWLCTSAQLAADACPYDARERPNVAARRELIPDVGDELPPLADPDDIWTVLQVNTLRAVETKEQHFEIDLYFRLVGWDDVSISGWRSPLLPRSRAKP